MKVFACFFLIVASSNAFPSGPSSAARLRGSTEIAAISVEDFESSLVDASFGLSEAEQAWYFGKVKADPQQASVKELSEELAIHRARAEHLQEALDKGCVDTAKDAFEECMIDDPRVECHLSEIERRWFDGFSGDLKGDMDKTLAALAKEKHDIAQLEEEIRAKFGDNLSADERAWYEGHPSAPKKPSLEHLKLSLAAHQARAKLLKKRIEKGETSSSKKALECDLEDKRIECTLSENEMMWFNGGTGSDISSLQDELAKEEREIESIEKDIEAYFLGP